MTLGPVSLLPRHVSVPRIGSQETKSSRARARAEDGSYKMISLPVPVLPTYQTRPPSPACQDDPCPRLFCGAASIQNIEKPSTATTTCGCRLASLTRPARAVAEQKPFIPPHTCRPRTVKSIHLHTVGTATATHQEVPSASRQLPEEDFHTHGSRATRSRVEAGPSPLQSVSSVFSSEILGGCDVCIRRGPFPP